MDYVYHILILVIMYAILVQSLNLIMGYVGVISMGHAVFSGIGAYTAAILSIHLGSNFLIGLAVGFIFSGLVGALLALPSLRVRDEYLIVFTVGFQMVVFEFMLTARGITQGQGGIPGIPPAELLGISFHTPLRFLPLLAVMGLICFAIAWRVTHSPFGRVLKAIREDESACRALGKNTLFFKVLVFGLSGGLAAITGSLMAHYISFISPFSFTIEVSVFIIVMVVLGGEANFWGPIMGAAILMGITEALRFVPGASSYIDAAREIFYGLILMFLMIFRPQGILPEYSKRSKKILIPKELLSRENGAADPDGIKRTPGRFQEENQEPILEIQGLSKSFGGLQAVAEASLKLFPGDITGLIGPNGCGKTTLFNMANGFMEPDQGAVYVRGKAVTGLAPYKLVTEGLVRSWQDVRVFKEMTVLDNVMVARPNQIGENLFLLFLRPGRVVREERENDQAALEYLQLVGLLDKAGQLAGSLSNAEQKLVAIARLLATECPILFLDEPTAALDIDSVERVIHLIQEIAFRKDKTILLVEHNLDVVRGLVKKAYFMSEGKILAEGEPAKLMADPKLAEVYFGID
ncbi:MAG: branched-chain amino acid ABC transporter ATP-binding protein/permease [Deltaproteobacteria bacterium]|nr:branched-chain amino acid ABC transporter ATP-binding protein/permease [Deltaproteobacteria bacterium]